MGGSFFGESECLHSTWVIFDTAIRSREVTAMGGSFFGNLTNQSPHPVSRVAAATPIAQFFRVLFSGMGGPVDIPGDQLRTIVERIEHIEKETSELNEGKREIYQEAKSNGFDPKVLREIVRLRKQDQKEREEHESLLEVYLRAINGARASKAA